MKLIFGKLNIFYSIYRTWIWIRIPNKYPDPEAIEDVPHTDFDPKHCPQHIV